jgi:exocyst complex protein 7
MARLEDEFCNILFNHTSSIELDSLDSIAISADPGSSSLSSIGTPSIELDDLDDDHLSEEDDLHRKKDEWIRTSEGERRESSVFLFIKICDWEVTVIPKDGYAK